jgi:hypothetical protein
MVYTDNAWIELYIKSVDEDKLRNDRLQYRYECTSWPVSVEVVLEQTGIKLPEGLDAKLVHAEYFLRHSERKGPGEIRVKGLNRVAGYKPRNTQEQIRDAIYSELGEQE